MKSASSKISPQEELSIALEALRLATDGIRRAGLKLDEEYERLRRRPHEKKASRETRRKEAATDA